MMHWFVLNHAKTIVVDCCRWEKSFYVSLIRFGSKMAFSCLTSNRYQFASQAVFGRADHASGPAGSYCCQERYHLGHQWMPSEPLVSE